MSTQEKPATDSCSCVGQMCDCAQPCNCACAD